MNTINRQWILKSRPKGLPGPEHFGLTEAPLPEVGHGQILVRNLYLSCDPAQRSWMERDTYIKAVPIGEVMRSGAVGQVIASRHSGFREGEVVSGMFGWQDYAVSDGRGFLPVTKLPGGVPIPASMSVLGPTGLTAYFGMLEVCAVRATDHVLVSGAAGATGSIAAQIAKLRNARVVGIAGGVEKCRWLKHELGLDEAVDYRSENVVQRLAELFPQGVDCFFDNVGGEILEAALLRLAPQARVALCGAISIYNDFERVPPLRNHTRLLVTRARMQGFLVSDYAARFAEAGEQLARWLTEGRLKNQVDIVDGLEHAPDAFRRLFTGSNLGKQLVRIADPVH